MAAAHRARANLRRSEEKTGPPGRLGKDRARPALPHRDRTEGGLMNAAEDLGTALARLERASRHHLAELWAEYFGAAPPPRTSRALMIRAVAYKMQERVLGRLSAATRRLLLEDTVWAARRSRVIRPGTVLIREWHGVAHQVTVGEEGVLYRGEHYRSLSEVARLITGARWSGPRFFGLKG